VPDETQQWGVFLDRDGTIIQERKYISNPDDVCLLPTVSEAITQLNGLNVPVIVITNQAGVARGLFSIDDVHKIHQRIDDLLSSQGAFINGYYFCPHHPTAGVNEYGRECECRKPKPGLLLQAANEHRIDPLTSYMIGDKPLDVEAGEAAGCKSLLVLTGYGRESAELVRQSSPNAGIYENLGDAVRFVINDAVSGCGAYRSPTR
jgi:D-glycero-D-manno-heptose 1,7-bisphosphate phosphatase